MLPLEPVRPEPVVAPGEFRFAAVGLDHNHISGMCRGLLEAGGELIWVADSNPARAAAFAKRFPGAQVADSSDQVLADPAVQLVASAAIPNRRCDLGLQVLAAGKDFFADKPPVTTLDQLSAARRQVAATGRKYAVSYSERLRVESAIYAGQLIAAGAIGRVVQVICLAPHRLGIERRPPWFFDREQNGGILCDIGSHQIDQFLFYSGATEAAVVHSRVGSYTTQAYPGLDDFGEALLAGDNGAAGYLRVDWLTPAGLRAHGDSRTFILGTHGAIEVRKEVDVARDAGGDHVFLVDGQGEHYLPVRGQVGFPYFGQLILDCLNRTENAMTQAHAFKVIELALLAEQAAVRLVDRRAT
jgi:predicted dehydrogenase